MKWYRKSGKGCGLWIIILLIISALIIGSLIFAFSSGFFPD